MAIKFSRNKTNNSQHFYDFVARGFCIVETLY